MTSFFACAIAAVAADAARTKAKPSFTLFPNFIVVLRNSRPGGAIPVRRRICRSNRLALNQIRAWEGHSEAGLLLRGMPGVPAMRGGVENFGHDACRTGISRGRSAKILDSFP